MDLTRGYRDGSYLDADGDDPDAFKGVRRRTLLQKKAGKEKNDDGLEDDSDADSVAEVVVLDEEFHRMLIVVRRACDNLSLNGTIDDQTAYTLGFETAAGQSKESLPALFAALDGPRRLVVAKIAQRFAAVETAKV